jgi:hypothetical protein
MSMQADIPPLLCAYALQWIMLGSPVLAARRTRKLLVASGYKYVLCGLLHDAPSRRSRDMDTDLTTLEGTLADDGHLPAH